MKIADGLKRLFRRQPPTPEQVAARAEAESELEQLHAQYASPGGHNPTGTEIPPVP